MRGVFARAKQRFDKQQSGGRAPLTAKSVPHAKQVVSSRQSGEDTTGLTADLSAGGQVSVEYLGITAFFLATSLVFFAYAFATFNDSKSSALAQDTVSRIASNSNLVASLGEGSRIFFDVEFPDNAQSIEVKEKLVRLNYVAGAGTTYAYAYTKVNLTPTTITVSSGRRNISAAFTDGNVVIN